MLEEDKKYLREQLELVIMLCVNEGFMSNWRSTYEEHVFYNRKISLTPSEKEELFQRMEKLVCDDSIPPNHLCRELEKFADNYIATLLS